MEEEEDDDAIEVEEEDSSADGSSEGIPGYVSIFFEDKSIYSRLHDMLGLRPGRTSEQVQGFLIGIGMRPQTLLLQLIVNTINSNPNLPLVSVLNKIYEMAPDYPGRVLILKDFLNLADSLTDGTLIRGGLDEFSQGRLVEFLSALRAELLNYYYLKAYVMIRDENIGLIEDAQAFATAAGVNNQLSAGVARGVADATLHVNYFLSEVIAGKNFVQWDADTRELVDLNHDNIGHLRAFIIWYGNHGMIHADGVNDDGSFAEQRIASFKGALESLDEIINNHRFEITDDFKGYLLRLILSRSANTPLLVWAGRPI